MLLDFTFSTLYFEVTILTPVFAPAVCAKLRKQLVKVQSQASQLFAKSEETNPIVNAVFGTPAQYLHRMIGVMQRWHKCRPLVNTSFVHENIRVDFENGLYRTLYQNFPHDVFLRN
jgi:hypothetical protein